MRITTTAMMRNYNTSLNTSMESMNTARERVADGKRFHRASEDPNAALRASDLSRKYLKIDDYTTNLSNCLNRQISADDIMANMVGMVGEQIESDTLKGMTGSSPADVRQSFATSLRQLQDSMLQSANAQYENSYLFAGADGGEMPFSKDEDGTIRYRGIDVTTGQWEGHTNQEGLAELEKLSSEKLYVDVGTGLQVDSADKIAGNSDDINGASAYNMALSGAKAFGFGSSGTPPISKNIFALVGQLADELEAPTLDFERFGKMRDQLKETHSTMSDYNAQMGVNENYLESAEKRLKTDKINLYTQLDSVQNVEPAEAIMDYNFTQYCYNLVLKVGNSLLSNSFIDFMR